VIRSEYCCGGSVTVAVTARVIMRVMSVHNAIIIAFFVIGFDTWYTDAF